MRSGTSRSTEQALGRVVARASRPRARRRRAEPQRDARQHASEILVGRKSGFTRGRLRHFSSSEGHRILPRWIRGDACDVTPGETETTADWRRPHFDLQRRQVGVFHAALRMIETMAIIIQPHTKTGCGSGLPLPECDDHGWGRRCIISQIVARYHGSRAHTTGVRRTRPPVDRIDREAGSRRIAEMGRVGDDDCSDYDHARDRSKLIAQNAMKMVDRAPGQRRPPASRALLQVAQSSRSASLRARGRTSGPTATEKPIFRRTLGGDPGAPDQRAPSYHYC